jgi:hypothetical protein
VFGFVKCRDLLVPFVLESHKRCEIVLMYIESINVCKCERLPDLESTCKVIFNLIHMYVFWFIKVFLYNTF